MDELYPSPMKKKTKYAGDINKRRRHDSQPYPKTSPFMLAGLSSKDYENEYAEWVSRQVELDNQGFRLLAEHYNLDIDSSDFYMKVALHLARDHVPAFHMKDAGRQKEWCEHELKLLVLRVRIEMKKGNGCKRSEAIERLSKEGETYGLQGNREGLRNMVIKGEKLVDIEKLDKYTTEELQEVERYQMGIVDYIKGEKQQWRD